MGTLHSPKLQHYWSLTIKLFCVLSRTFVRGVLLLWRDAVCWLGSKPIFVAASHQRGLDTRSVIWRLIKVGIRGEEDRAQAKAQALVTMMHLVHPKVAQLKPWGLKVSSRPLLERAPTDKPGSWSQDEKSFCLLLESSRVRERNVISHVSWSYLAASKEERSYLPTPPLGQDMTQGQFLSGVQQVWIQSFPSPRLVTSPRLKNLVCPTIYP